MNVVSAVLVGWTILLMGLRFGRASSITYDRLNETGPTGENKGEKRQLLNERALLLGNLIKTATGLSESNVYGIFNYGCWCGRRGGGKIVDNFDYCCKVHDFCEKDLGDRDKCGANPLNIQNEFEYDESANTCTPASEYRKTNDEEEKKCGYSVCLCDMEMVRCMANYKNDFNEDKIGYDTRQCAISAPITGQPKADVVVLIQDSQGISKATFRKIKKVVRRLLTLLGNDDDTHYNFALATYAKSRRMSCFGNAEETISYMDKKFRHGRRGRKNLFKRALIRMILKQFQARRDEDTAKLLVIFSDGRAELGNGDVMDTFKLEKTAKRLRVKNNIKMIGALIPNAQNTQRIQELKGIVSEPDDALDADFSASNFKNEIADFLASRVKRLTKVLVTYTVKVYTPDAYVNREFSLTVRVKGQGEQKTSDQLLINPTEETEGNLHVIKSEFFDVDVGVIQTVEILPDRKVNGGRGWTLKEIKVTKKMETVTAVFDESIPTWPFKWKSASATSSDEDTEA